jgi:hypothetical protein
MFPQQKSKPGNRRQALHAPLFWRIITRIHGGPQPDRALVDKGHFYQSEEEIMKDLIFTLYDMISLRSEIIMIIKGGSDCEVESSSSKSFIR